MRSTYNSYITLPGPQNDKHSYRRPQWGDASGGLFAITDELLISDREATYFLQGPAQIISSAQNDAIHHKHELPWPISNQHNDARYVMSL